MGPTKELIDDIYRQRVNRARAMAPEDKLLAGPRLFEMACRITAEGIRAQFPHADEAEVRRILRDRLAWRRRVEDHP